MTKAVAMRRWVPWLVFALFGAAACQVVVGETELTTVHCQDEGAEGPPACAVGQVCVNGVCVSGASASDGGAGAGGSGGTGAAGGTGGGGTGGGGTGGTSTAGTGGTAGIPDGGDADTPDAPPDGDSQDVQTDTPDDVAQDVVEEPPPQKGLGDPCNADAECLSKHCFQAPYTQNKVCSDFCCASSDCLMPNGVCVAYGGTNACFSSADAMGLPTVGSKAVGEPCGNGSECITGRCSGNCVDSCCISYPGCDCALAQVSGRVDWYCGAASGATANLDECAGSNECASNNCEDFNNLAIFTIFSGARCGGPCCKDEDCKLSGWDGYCEYVWQGSSNPVRQCTPWSTLRPSDHRPCCRDSDCSGNQKCRFVEEEGFNANYSTILSQDAWGFRCVD